MKRKEMINKVANLNCMLKCLRAIDSDDVEAIQSIPQALIIASEYADSLYEAIIDSDE